jgi:hypothetical protein
MCDSSAGFNVILMLSIQTRGCVIASYNSLGFLKLGYHYYNVLKSDFGKVVE